MIRRWFFWVMLAAFVTFLIVSRAEIAHLARTIAAGRWRWLLLAVVLQAGYFVTCAWLYRGAMTAVGVRVRFEDTLVPLLGTLFVNVAIPSGGAAGAALFMDAAARRGESSARAAAGLLLAMVANFSSLSLVLVIGMAYLLREHQLSGYELVGAVLLALLTAAMGALLLFGLWRPGWLRAILGAAERMVARAAALVRRPTPLAHDWTERTANDFIAVSTALTHSHGALVRLLALALATHALNCASLGALFPAFRLSVTVGAVIAGYSVGMLAWALSPALQGIGVVEGALALVFTSLGVAARPATFIAVAFRGITFWIPMAIGMALLRRLRSHAATTSPPRR